MKLGTRNDRLMPPCPTAGAGVHAWTYRVACEAARRGWSHSETAAYIVESATRHMPEREVRDAVTNGFRAVSSEPIRGRLSWPSRYKPKPKPWPAPDEALCRGVESDGFGLVDLWERSPIRIEPGTPPHIILAELFSADDLICAAVAREHPHVRPLTEWGEQIDRCRLIVPNVATARKGLTKDGRPSSRALSMFPNRSHLVIEFDSSSLDEQAARIRYLATKAPLAMAVFSGGKSLHAWFPCGGVSANPLREFFELACRLGADPAIWQRHQFVRLPEARREGTGARQSIYYLNAGLK